MLGGLLGLLLRLLLLGGRLGDECGLLSFLVDDLFYLFLLPLRLGCWLLLHDRSLNALDLGLRLLLDDRLALLLCLLLSVLLDHCLLHGRLLGIDFTLSNFSGKLNFFLGLLDRRDDDLFRRLLRHGRFLRRSCLYLRLLGLRELLGVLL